MAAPDLVLRAPDATNGIRMSAPAGGGSFKAIWVRVVSRVIGGGVT